LRVFELSLMCQEPSRLSMLYVIKNWKGYHLLEMLGGAQTYRVVGGSQAPANAMARALGSSVRFSDPVIAIAQDAGNVTVRTRTGRRVWAKYVLYTGSPWTALKVAFSPALPSDLSQLFRTLPLGNAVKMSVVYDTPFWRRDGRSGFIASDVAFDGVVFSSCQDNSPIGSAQGAMLCFCSGDCALQMMRLDTYGRQAALTKFLARSLGPAALSPIHYIDHDWSAEPYIGGAFQINYPPGVLTHLASALTDFGRVSWAGSDTLPPTDSSFGYMDGAIKTGRTAAKKLAALLAPRH